MSLRVTFDLDENDLKHFRLIMREAQKAAAGRTPEDIVAAAGSLLEAAGSPQTPGFIVERLSKLELMLDMLSDIDWRLPHEDARRVLNALAYFAEPEDLIPDHIPGLGFLDDAIMIELVVRELRHEIEAYEDFRAYRERMQAEEGARVGREDWLGARREALQSRMRRRRADKGPGARPGLFR